MEISSEVEPDERHSSYPHPSILSSCPESEEEISTSFSFKLALETRDKWRMPFCPLNVTDSWAFPHRSMPAAVWRPDSQQQSGPSEHLRQSIKAESFTAIPSCQIYTELQALQFALQNTFPSLLTFQSQGLGDFPGSACLRMAQGLLEPELAARKANRTQSISRRVPTRLWIYLHLAMGRNQSFDFYWSRVVSIAYYFS